MKKFAPIFGLLMFCAAFVSQAANERIGYISDELFIYMHTGAGNNFRIAGTITAGSQIQLTGATENDYTQIIDDKERTLWVESQYISEKAGLRFVIAELNAELATTSETKRQLEQELANAQATVDELQDKNKQLTQQFSQLSKNFSDTQAQLKDQDTNIMKQWFFNGAIVLGVGLLLGLLLPRLVKTRRSSMDSWK